MPRGRPKQNNKGMSMTTEDRTKATFIRESDRLSKEMDTRSRSSIYDEPDYDNLTPSPTGVSFNLLAPKPRIHPRDGKPMRQRWANKNEDNGARVANMQERGWIIRDPANVPPNYPFRTEKWNGENVIGVAEHILMEMPEFYYKKLEAILVNQTNSKTESIRRSHGSFMRDTQGGWDGSDKMRGYNERFSQEVTVQREEGGGDGNISFAE